LGDSLSTSKSVGLSAELEDEVGEVGDGSAVDRVLKGERKGEKGEQEQEGEQGERAKRTCPFHDFVAPISLLSISAISVGTWSERKRGQNEGTR
jgi:hypothetical protein